MDSSKFAVIHNDGSIEYYGNRYDLDEYHIFSLLEYAKEKYPDVEIFKKLNIRHSPEVAAFFYTRLGDIIILNDTDAKEKYGKTGWALVPDEITKEAKDALYDFASKTKDYKIKLTYDLNMDTGVLAGHTLYDMEGDFKKVIDTYYETINNEKKSTR
ncbi:MAG: hypothetical protein IJ565_04575 [Bacilli bacterium]|nr:hypothetical protein [Bacilli bacterium]